jgi:hypothetical protein
MVSKLPKIHKIDLLLYKTLDQHYQCKLGRFVKFFHKLGKLRRSGFARPGTLFLPAIETWKQLQIRVARWHTFKPKFTSRVIFCRVLQWKMLVYFMTTICYIVWSFEIFHGYLVHFSRFGMLYQKNMATL